MCARAHAHVCVCMQLCILCITNNYKGYRLSVRLASMFDWRVTDYIYMTINASDESYIYYLARLNQSSLLLDWSINKCYSYNVMTMVGANTAIVAIQGNKNCNLVIITRSIFV